MTSDRRGRTVVSFPSELEIVVSRPFEAPIDLVFDVLTKVEHVRETIAPFGETVTECAIDLRAGGNYRFVFVPDGGPECAFRGTYLEVERPTRTVETWHFEGWPDVEAVETFDLREDDGVTTLIWTLAFRDRAGRDHMAKVDGIEGNFDNLDRYLTALRDRERT